MNQLLMLCGIPTSGKSTYVQKLKTLDDWKDAVVLSTDNYIEEYAKGVGQTYNEVFDDVIDDATKELELQLSFAKANGKNIIWDQTNLSAKARRKKLRKIPISYRKDCVYFTIPLEEALERNNHREGKFIPESIIKRMWYQFEVPTLEEGFDYVEKV